MGCFLSLHAWLLPGKQEGGTGGVAWPHHWKTVQGRVHAYAEMNDTRCVGQQAVGSEVNWWTSVEIAHNRAEGAGWVTTNLQNQDTAF